MVGENRRTISALLAQNRNRAAMGVSCKTENMEAILIKEFLKRIFPASVKRLNAVEKNLSERLDGLERKVCTNFDAILVKLDSLESGQSRAAGDVQNLRQALIDEMWKVRDDVNLHSFQDFNRMNAAVELNHLKIANIEKMSRRLFCDAFSHGRDENVFLRQNLLTAPDFVQKRMKETSENPFSVVRSLMWQQMKIPFEDLDYMWRYIFEHCVAERDVIFEHYTAFLFQHGDLLGNLASTYENNLPHFESWTSLTKLSYISFLFYSGDEKKALSHLKMYVKANGEKDLDYFIPVSFLACKHLKIKSEAVQKNARRFEMLQQKPGVFENLVKNGRVSLVGNGPQEKGKKSGAKIDAADVVIRFNTYRISKDFEEDYGKKVTVWANGVQICEDGERAESGEKGDFKYFLYLPEVYSASTMGRFLDDFENVIAFDINKARKEIWQKTGVYCPSNGLILIWYIKRLNPKFSADDCYGFSFKEKNLPTEWLHYDKDAAVETCHLLDKEKMAIEKIFADGEKNDNA